MPCGPPREALRRLLQDRRPGATGRAATSFLLLAGLCCAGWAQAETVRVERVLDGDTVVLEDGRTVRYLGINAPEWQEPLWRRATRRNEALVLQRPVRLEFEGEREDRYGRLLAWMHIGDQTVNLRLVQEGLAHVFLIPPNLGRARELLDAQAEAQRDRRGMWRHLRGPLKVTAVRMDDRNLAGGARAEEYVRVANVSAGTVGLAGYRLSTGAGRTYVFPDFALEAGHTALVLTGLGRDGRDGRGQLRLYWDVPGPVWDLREDTATVEDPAGQLVDVFHYKGRRVSRAQGRRRGS